MLTMGKAAIDQKIIAEKEFCEKQKKRILKNMNDLAEELGL